MKLLEDSERKEAISYMDAAVKTAVLSPCRKEKRGVIIVKDDKIIGEGVNAPPLPFKCEPDYCGDSCRVPAIHAEMNAILNVKNKQDLEGAILYHARIDENGVLQDSRKPRCADCSKHILQAKIEGVVLKHEEGYIFYESEEFHKISLENFKKRGLI